MNIKEKLKQHERLYHFLSMTIVNVKRSFMHGLNIFCGLNQKKVVFISWNGDLYSDNPKAISEKLHEMWNQAEIVWIFKKPEEKKMIVPEYVKCIKNHTFAAVKELATAKFWVDNMNKDVAIYKSKKQVYIQTWHGDRGFKKILYESSNIDKRDKYIESEICDLAISGSEFGNRLYTNAFRYKGEIMKEGCPRNDNLVNNNREISKTVKKRFNINQETKIILYAPTFKRYEPIQNVGMIDFTEILKILEMKTNDKWICFVRAHNVVSELAGIPDSDQFIDVSTYEDMGDLLLSSDILITDYSSSAGDFALLAKPIILFQNDRDTYIEKERTFYFDIEDAPFLVATTGEELIRLIQKLEILDPVKNCREILEFYGTRETGRASEKVAEYIIKKMSSQGLDMFSIEQKNEVIAE